MDNKKGNAVKAIGKNNKGKLIKGGISEAVKGKAHMDHSHNITDTNKGQTSNKSKVVTISTENNQTIITPDDESQVLLVQYKALPDEEPLPANNNKWSRLSTAGPAVQANGSAKPRSSKDLKRTDSLTVPAGQDADDGPDSPRRDSSTSRRSSARSDSPMSTVDLSKLNDAQVTSPAGEDDDQSKALIHKDDMYIRSVIPYLPMWLAVVCFLLNVFVPGLGTMLSGVSVFCCGRHRAKSKEDTRMRTLCTNVMVGFMQLFTVTFMLVGWFWSLVWGIYMLILAAENMKTEKAKHDKELQAKTLSALNTNLRPWTLMRD